MYCYENRVSYSQLDRSGGLGITHILDVMQDACMFHCQEAGRSCMDLKTENKAWLVSSWHVIFRHFPEMGKKYRVKVWPYKIHGVFNCQNVVLESDDGDLIAAGDSRWFFYDSGENKPIRIPEEEKAVFEISDSYDMPYAPRKLVCPDDTEFVQTVTVCPAYLDTNNHVNNGQYVHLAATVLPDGFLVNEMRAEFRNAAHLGDILYIRTKKSGNTFVVVFENKEGIPYFISEFYG